MKIGDRWYLSFNDCNLIRYWMDIWFHHSRTRVGEWEMLHVRWNGSSQLDIAKKLMPVRITLGTGQQNLLLGGFQDLTEQRVEQPGVNSAFNLLWAGGSTRWLPTVLSNLDYSVKDHLTESKPLSIYYQAKKQFFTKKYHWDLQSAEEPAIAQINPLVNHIKVNQITTSHNKKLSKTS